MTVGYNSGVKNCLDTLVFECKKNNIPYKLENLEKFTKEFHDFIKNKLFEYLFKDPRDSIKESNFLTLSDAHINLNYFYTRRIATKKDIKLKDKRWVLSKNIISLNLDDRSTYTAFNANVVQALDAEFARYIAIKLTNVIIIHDSFGVSIFDLHILMDESNIYFQEKLESDTYSIFILI